jgi:hypothetical protein
MKNIYPSLKILLISQWPNIKNGEYELIEKIKRTHHEVTVVDYLGFDVQNGACLNDERVSEEYDFAVSFHYDTPKLLNIRTFLWIANPLEFMHLRGDYYPVLLNHLRAYDDYLFNGSDTLKQHIKNILGSEWIDSGLEMFPSTSLQDLIPPKTREQLSSEAAHKVFYCGVNWERGIDRAGRAQGLLDILQDKDAADFFGPSKLEGISPWEGFNSYKGEIPFDGISMSQVMRQYGAVLAVSSPAHMKSQTSSSRVFEGIAAGVPVISDHNPHVIKLFGDSVYYFEGNNESEKVESILSALKQINDNPEKGSERVMKAQLIMEERFCFEPCFDRVREYLVRQKSSSGRKLNGKKLTINLLHHDADYEVGEYTRKFENLKHVVKAAVEANQRHGLYVLINICGEIEIPSDLLLPSGVKINMVSPESITDILWKKLRLGEKIGLLSRADESDFINFITQFEYPHSDFYVKALDWFAEYFSQPAGIFIGGFYVSDLTQKATLGTTGIVRNNSSVSAYRWTQNSLAEHQMGTIVLGKEAMPLLSLEKIQRFDVLLPVSIIADTTATGLPVHRSRHILVRARFGHFHRHYEAYRRATEKGFWAQHYELQTNYNHELNAMFDVHHESPIAREIIDQVSGHALPPTPPIDPAVYAVNNFIARLRPLYRLYKRLRP